LIRHTRAVEFILIWELFKVRVQVLGSKIECDSVDADNPVVCDDIDTLISLIAYNNISG